MIDVQRVDGAEFATEDAPLSAMPHWAGVNRELILRCEDVLKKVFSSEYRAKRTGFNPTLSHSTTVGRRIEWWALLQLKTWLSIPSKAVARGSSKGPAADSLT
ncbi:hypothetical protein EG328_011160 [Venturia inaequalis]|uniref:Uncharacterized protein n=1 Tax=Venturia inaequalis TaxID=5025 RepID=A0A8H3VGL5_VENIN|nr:hypothetical protein EG328_011160 [Venturia inaequalis]